MLAWLPTLPAAPAFFDFDDDDAASPTQPGWTSLKQPSLTATSQGLSVTITPLGAVTIDDRDRAAANGGGDQADLWRDFIFANGSSTEGTGLQIAITGLEPEADYPITLWAFDKSSTNRRMAEWSANDGDGGAFQSKGTLAFNGNEAAPTSLEDYRLDFTITADAAGEVILRGLKSADGTAGTHNVFLTALALGEGGPPGTEPVEGEPLRINELLASNSRGLEDGFGDNEDWIELHNPNTAAVSLAGWTLTDDATQPAKWTFPEGASIPGQGYLVVFASGKDTVDPDGRFHTNFSLSAAGESLSLFPPAAAEPEDALAMFPPQATDVSYGRPAGAAETWGYLTPPTPGAANAETSYEGLVEGPAFSATRGFYDAPFTLTLATATEGAVLHYTLDSSLPTAASPVYGEPLALTGTTVVRAMALKPGWMPTKVVTHTYIFPDQVAQQPAAPEGFPATWGTDSEVNSNDGAGNGTVPADYEMDPRVAAAALPGYGVREALLDLPTLSLVLPRNDLFHATTGIYSRPTVRTERPCSLELIHPDGAEGFQENAIVEIHGNSSRRPWRMQKHSFRVTFRGSVGLSKLRYPIFPDSPLDRWDKLVLRACFTDSWGLVSWDPGRYRPNDSQYLRDVWMKQSLADMGHPSTHGNFCHLYVDGLYWGLHNPTERLEATYFADRFGGEETDWELNADFESPGPRWNAMMTSSSWTQIQTFVDVENFADYMLLHIFADAEDWPHHNGYAATCPALGFPFRFFVWDQEIVLDNHNMNRIDDNRGAGALFQKLRTYPEFRLLFADRVQRHLFNGGALTAAIAGQRYLALAAQIDKAIVAESARWGDTRSSLPYGTTIQQPSPLTNFNHQNYPPAPNGPNFFFTREQSWLVERDNIVNNYLPDQHNPANTYATTRKLRARNLWPALEPPVLSQHGGTLPEQGLALTLTHPNAEGTIHVTTDGRDPRDPATGDPEGEAYTEPLTVSRADVIKARVRNGTAWSALTEAAFVVASQPASAANLVISELHYQPAGNALEEFLELLNISDTMVNLGGAAFTTGIEFTFAEGVTLAPGARVILVRNAAAFAARYGEDVTVGGAYTGALDNAGETLSLVAANGDSIAEFAYAPAAPWPAGAAGGGYSLTLLIPTAKPDPALPGSWRESVAAGGSPGAGDALPYTLGPPEADDDGDGVPNLFHYALVGTPELQPLENDTWQFTLVRRPGADAATIALETSIDLVTWEPLTTSPVLSRTADGGREIWPLPPSPSPDTPLFVRVKGALR